MAQLLYERHSSNLVLKTVKRHLRLCRQNKGTEAHATAIEPAYNALLEKREAVKTAEEDYESNYDLLVIMDAELDDKVRDAKEAALKFDRDHPGEMTTRRLFPNGLTPIVFVSSKKESSEVDQLILRINDLGATHELHALIEPLQSALNSCKEALDALALSSEKVTTAETLEKIAKINLVRQYEKNYYTVVSRFGKQFSRRLFPRLVVPKKNDAENDGE
ncbi:hypothetical protein [Roseimarinus sediminis]|uniref:hypothetical protein n=1 Tax=Roseimarinus sediminis TaxID=1610899 RepID=UPI003D22AC28